MLLGQAARRDHLDNGGLDRYMADMSVGRGLEVTSTNRFYTAFGSSITLSVLSLSSFEIAAPVDILGAGIQMTGRSSFRASILP